MSFFKFIFGIVSFVGAGEMDGWVPVEKVPRAEEVMTDIDPSIWVLFSKKIGFEKFSIRFPEDPSYQKIEGGFVLRASRNGETFEVTVQNKNGEISLGSSIYEREGKWIHDQVVQSEQSTFVLRTYSPEFESPNHAIFTASFSVRS